MILLHNALFVLIDMKMSGYRWFNWLRAVGSLRITDPCPYSLSSDFMKLIYLG